jgi:hypothetical protein
MALPKATMMVISTRFPACSWSPKTKAFQKNRCSQCSEFLSICPIRCHNYLVIKAAHWEQREQWEHSGKSGGYGWARLGNALGTPWEQNGRSVLLIEYSG